MPLRTDPPSDRPGATPSALDAERFGLCWPGKAAALETARSPAVGRLAPIRDESGEIDEAPNRIIEGDNLDALKLLEPELVGTVKMIYIDPPYNTGRTFLYRDTFRKSGRGRRSAGDPAAAGGRRHAPWLDMIYPRLAVARRLLRDDGCIFVSIDDHEVHHLRLVMDEIFGEENFVAHIVWQKKFAPQNDTRYLSDVHDHILLFARRKSRWKRRLLPPSEAALGRYRNLDDDPRGAWSSGDLTVKTYCAANDYPVTTPTGRVARPSASRCWAVSRERMEELIRDGRIWFGRGGSAAPRLKQFLSETQAGVVPTTLWLHAEVGHNQEAKQELKRLLDGDALVFDTPKPVRLIQRMLAIATAPDEEAVVLDFFAGSGTTGHAVLEMNRQDGGNRRFVLIQSPDPTGSPACPTLADLTRARVRKVIERIGERAAGFRHYRLMRPDEG